MWRQVTSLSHISSLIFLIDKRKILLLSFFIKNYFNIGGICDVIHPFYINMANMCKNLQKILIKNQATVNLFREYFDLSNVELHHSRTILENLSLNIRLILLVSLFESTNKGFIKFCLSFLYFSIIFRMFSVITVSYSIYFSK